MEKVSGGTVSATAVDVALTVPCGTGAVSVHTVPYEAVMTETDLQPQKVETPCFPPRKDVMCCG